MLREGTRRNRLKLAEHFEKGKISMPDQEALDYIDAQGEDWGEWEVVYCLAMGLSKSKNLETAVRLESLASTEFARMSNVAMGEAAFTIRYHLDATSAIEWAVNVFRDIPESFACGIARALWRNRVVISHAQEAHLQQVIMDQEGKYPPVTQLIKASAGWSPEMRSFLGAHTSKSLAADINYKLEQANKGLYEYPED